jgi:hypothetical protein
MNFLFWEIEVRREISNARRLFWPLAAAEEQTRKWKETSGRQIVEALCG